MKNLQIKISENIYIPTGYSTLPRSSQSDTGGSRMETSNSTGFLTNLDNCPIYSDVAALETVTEDHETLGLPKLHTSGS